MTDGLIILGFGLGGAAILIGGAELLVHKSGITRRVLDGAITDLDHAAEDTRLRCTTEGLLDDPAARQHKTA